MNAPAKNQAPRAGAVAEFLLNTAQQLGIGVWTNGADELVAVIPLKLPSDVCRCFEKALASHKAEVIDLILAARTGRAAS
jgi:hypothetical protein